MRTVINSNAVNHKLNPMTNFPDWQANFTINGEFVPSTRLFGM